MINKEEKVGSIALNAFDPTFLFLFGARLKISNQLEQTADLAVFVNVDIEGFSRDSVE